LRHLAPLRIRRTENLPGELAAIEAAKPKL
jgi:hypothetical protein